jgi:hypothetical protein
MRGLQLQRRLPGLAVAAAILLVGHGARGDQYRPINTGLVWLMLGLILASEWRWLRDRQRAQGALTRLLVKSSAALLIVLLPVEPVGILIAAGLVAFQWSLERDLTPRHELMIALVTQFATLWAIFLGAAVWHLPAWLVLGLVWGSSLAVAHRLLASYEERNLWLLAAAWALIVTECAKVFSTWLVNYILPGGLAILPQPAVVLTALGYCLAGIYTAHRTAQLSKKRLTEYLLIGLCLIIIVIVGTKWSGSV